ncbi:restriction endonuclease subunit S [Cryptobacterium curtum]|nr:restriction endonuclease subunit S [Cryptobacterium curtum]
MAAKSKTPEIRFKGFTDPWEQRKLGDVLTERNIQRAQSEDFPLVSFTVENGVTPKTERYDREQLVRGDRAAKKYKETRLDDIVYNPANLKFGAIARNTLRNAVFSPIYVTFNVDETAAPSFIEKVVTRSRFIQGALRYQQGTVYERMSVSPEELCDLNVTLPYLDEQQYIGSYFTNLDHLITLHQRKCDKLKQLKQSLLEKMFV